MSDLCFIFYSSNINLGYACFSQKLRENAIKKITEERKKKKKKKKSNLLFLFNSSNSFYLFSFVIIKIK